MRQQTGFTLIELMIVVAIIGILAAIAVPAYQNYTVRAKISEGVIGATAAKMHVSESYQANFVAGLNSAVASWNVASTRSKYVTSITLNNTGVVVATFAADGSNGLPTNLDGTTLVFTPSMQGQPLTTTLTGTLEWSCKSTTSATARARSLFVAEDVAATLPAEYAPSECR